MRTVGTATIAWLLFGSGFAALVYQTAWQRMLPLVFGATTAASSAVLAVFLGGLGLGGWLLGKRAERDARPLMLYGTLELGVAITAAVTPFLIDGVARVYWALGGSARVGPYGATVVRLALTCVALGPTVVLMGGTLPAAVRAAESETDDARRRLAWLYGVNTTGAVAGALLGTFMLFELFGTRLALWSAVLINVLVAVVARGIGRDLAPVAAQSEPDGPAEAPEEVAPTGVESELPAWTVYGSAAVAGAAFLCMELVWYRMLSPILGGTTFTFGLILAVALAGIGVGGALYAARPEARRPTPSLLALTMALEALLIAVPFAAGDSIAVFTGHVRAVSALGFAPMVAVWSLVAGAVVFGASLVAGYQFPVLVGLLGRGRNGIARQLGLTYAFNTIGSITGALVGGFVLIPALGAVETWRGVCWLLLGWAAVLTGIDRWRARGGRTRGGRFGALAPSAGILSVAGVAMFLSLSHGPTAVWRHSGIGAGRAKIPTGKNELRAWMVERQKGIIWERDGAELSVALNEDDSLSFVVGGKNDGNVWGDRATQVMSPVLPSLLHPSPTEFFIVGLGTGMSAGWAASLPDVERVTVAELEPAIEHVAAVAHAANHDVLKRDDVTLFRGDAREFLLTTNQTFDLIFSEPSNPYRAGIANLFTREMYEHARSRLKDGGWYAQWLQGYEVDADSVRTVLRTLRGVFGFVEIWQTAPNDLLLIASREPITVDAQLVRRKLELRPYRDAVRRTWLVDDLEGVLGRHLAPDPIVAAIASVPGTATNTDDRNILEYAFAKSVGSGSDQVGQQLSTLAMGHVRGRPAVRGDVDWVRVDELAYRDVWGGPLESFPRVPRSYHARATAFNMACHGLGVWRHQDWSALLEGEPADFVERAMRTQAQAALGLEEYRLGAIALRDEGFAVEALLAEATFAVARSAYGPALGALDAALGALRVQANPLCNTAGQVMQLVRLVALEAPGSRGAALDAVLVGPLAAHQVEATRRRVAQEIAMGIAGDPSACVRALGPELTHPWWEADFLTKRVACLTRARHPLAAGATMDLQEFLAATAGNVSTGLDLD